jgi:hypothetical protein
MPFDECPYRAADGVDRRAVRHGKRADDAIARLPELTVCNRDKDRLLLGK